MNKKRIYENVIILRGTFTEEEYKKALEKIKEYLAKYENNTVTLCVQKGYILNDRVIRPAKVKVNKI